MISDATGPDRIACCCDWQVAARSENMHGPVEPSGGPQSASTVRSRSDCTCAQQFGRQLVGLVGIQARAVMDHH